MSALGGGLVHSVSNALPTYFNFATSVFGCCSDVYRKIACHSYYEKLDIVLEL